MGNNYHRNAKHGIEKVWGRKSRGKNFVLDERILCSNISSKQIDTSHMTEAKHRKLRVDEVTSSGKKLLIQTLDKVELYRVKFDNLKLLMSLKDVLRGFGVYWNLLRGEKSSRIKFYRSEKLQRERKTRQHFELTKTMVDTWCKIFQAERKAFEKNCCAMNRDEFLKLTQTGWQMFSHNKREHGKSRFNYFQGFYLWLWQTSLTSRCKLQAIWSALLSYDILLCLQQKVKAMKALLTALYSHF